MSSCRRFAVLGALPHTLPLLVLALVAAGPSFAVQCTDSQAGGLAGLPNPVLFVSQFPISGDFATIGSTFANHFPDVAKVGRGGDLWILYPDGSLCNVTREGGFGETDVHQGLSSIAVRDPYVHWDGSKALFSMVIGSGEEQFDDPDTYWQLYELTGLAQGVPVSITRVANQPVDYNNLTPVYGPDGRILFTSDRPRDGRRHLYPQRDEYESTPTNTGLWALDPSTGELTLFDHSPSGVFTPTVDSFGRVLFTRWDHLQRDQQADNPSWQAFDFASEEDGAAQLAAFENFPEKRINPDPPFQGHRFNHFFPWMINADGTEHETLNHIGRHELHGFFSRNRNDDPNIRDFTLSIEPDTLNENEILNFFHIVEDPSQPGRYYGTEAPEFGSHGSGGIIRFDVPPGADLDQVTVTYITHPSTHNNYGGGGEPPPEHTGHYRNPLIMSDGTLISAHTFETGPAGNDGDRANPDPIYDFRLRTLTLSGEHFEGAVALTGASGIARSVTYFDPDVQVNYNGPFWEWSPVEVRVKPQPPVLTEPALQSPEAQVFADEGVDPEEFRSYLREHELALVVSRDVTTRDKGDRQQPYNLRIDGGTAETLGAGGIVYDIKYLQFFQGDQVRGYQGRGGRRVLAREMHQSIDNPPTTGAPGSVDLAADGSMAAMIPAHRAMSWSLNDPASEAVVRERYWLTFQAGEIRVCASCHGLNSLDQAGGAAPSNPPEALRTLLRHWRLTNTLFDDGFESGDTGAWSSSAGG